MIATFGSGVIAPTRHRTPLRVASRTPTLLQFVGKSVEPHHSVGRPAGG